MQVPGLPRADGHRVEVEFLLWGTGYGVDLSYFPSPEIASICTLNALAPRCGCIFRSLDAANLYFPGVGLDGIGSAAFFSLLCRSMMSHIRGTARLDNEALGHRLNHFDIVDYLGPRDPTSYPPNSWRAHYRDIALSTSDEQPYPIPAAARLTTWPSLAFDLLRGRLDTTSAVGLPTPSPDGRHVFTVRRDVVAVHC